MKELILFTIASAILFSFSNLPAWGINGQAGSAATIRAIAGADSLKTTASLGAFEFTDAKPGSYTIIIGAKAPYRSFVKEGVAVNDGEVTDLGSITLEQ